MLNQRRAVQSDAVYEDGPYTVSNTYGMGTYFSAPRSVRVSASYDF